MKRGRKPENKLSSRDKRILERFNSTVNTMPELAKQHGITKQRIHQILMRAQRLGYVMNRPKLSARFHQIHQCETCSKIVQTAEKVELVTKRQLAQMLNIKYEVCDWHLSQLKRAGHLSKTFATLRSDNIIKALCFYKNSSLSANAVGSRFGYKNFSSILNYQKQKGINIDKTLESSGRLKLDQGGPIEGFPFLSQSFDSQA